MCSFLLNRKERACIEVNAECLSDIHVSTKQCNCQAKKQENPLFSFPRQTIDEELSLLVFKNKRKITTELLGETCGEKQFPVPFYCSLFGRWHARKIWYFSLWMNEYYIGRTRNIALHQVLCSSSKKGHLATTWLGRGGLLLS